MFRNFFEKIMIVEYSKKSLFVFGETNRMNFKTKQDKEKCELLQVFNYLKDKSQLKYLSIINISCVFLTFLFNFFLGHVITILIQFGFPYKNFKNDFLIIIIVLFLLFLLNSLDFKAKSFSKSELLHELCYQSSSSSKEIDNSSEIQKISTDYIDNILITERNASIVIYGIFLASLIMYKIAIPITIVIILFFLVSQIGNKFVDEIQEKEKEEKKKEKKQKNPADHFLASLTSNDSFREKLFQCDHYCHVCVLLEKSFQKVPFIKEVLIELFSTLVTGFFIYYSSYLNVMKFEDIVHVLVFALLFAVNESTHFVLFLENFQKVQNSSKNILPILQKKNDDVDKRET